MSDIVKGMVRVKPSLLFHFGEGKALREGMTIPHRTPQTADYPTRHGRPSKRRDVEKVLMSYTWGKAQPCVFGKLKKLKIRIGMG